jgi:hypothetical protein
MNWRQLLSFQSLEVFLSSTHEIRLSSYNGVVHSSLFVSGLNSCFDFEISDASSHLLLAVT